MPSRNAVMTTPLRISRSDHVDIRGLRYHVREWGTAGAPQLFMLHGWMDASASFQFVVDALQRDWHVVAPDWRGCGLSDRPAGANGYRFIDLLADLDEIIEQRKSSPTINLVGHSMGANVACHYAGIRPALVRRLVSLEGFGPLLRNGDEAPEAAPVRLAQWLDDMRNLQPFPPLRHRGRRDCRAVPEKSPSRREPGAIPVFPLVHGGADGSFQRLGDPAYKVREPGRYRPGEVDAVWAAVTAPVLYVSAHDATKSVAPSEAAKVEQFRLRLRAFKDFREEPVNESGHMIHHDQPEKAAALIDEFCV
jgi:pimeloyl-ACP methyl ester carboxylesterase